MRHEVAVALLVAFALGIGGCGTVSRTTTLTAMVTEQERAFAGGLEFLRTGNERSARTQFERVIASDPLGGVTDEALFRLALLYLRDEGGKGGGRALALLEQLRKEFPASIWAHQAAPLIGFIGARTPRDLQREVKTLREQNLSLTRDNRELRQTIERLKSLDLELEQKIRH